MDRNHNWWRPLLSIGIPFLLTPMVLIVLILLGELKGDAWEVFRELGVFLDPRAMAVLILVLGNVLVIGLEGLSAGIQALRLNYYEFFTKFFHGTGKLYAPISLANKT